ncbi:single-stranded DNA-binding protein [Nakamurella lactea]|uniref:single-stranded DNA-binding protein n=1 Tax=Nakamurella lactea TaxID=459515 RepID=UPI00041D508E|nr:single-stranded DNA-binding protein [Nakamurella lactea]
MSYNIIEGDLAAEPETAVAESGTTWTRIRVITNDRYKDRDGIWIDGPPVPYQVTAFRRLAENITDTLHKGNRVVVAGTVTTKGYRDSDGNVRGSREIIADHVGASLALATATITRNSPTGTGADEPEQHSQVPEPAGPTF